MTVATEYFFRVKTVPAVKCGLTQQGAPDASMQGMSPSAQGSMLRGNEL